MIKLFSAIARALASATRTILVKCAATGDWIVKTITGGGGGGGGAPSVMDEIGQEVAQDLLKPVATGVPLAAGGDGYDRIQRACRTLNVGEQPAAEDLRELTSTQREWLTLLDPRMRLVVGNVAKASLIEHMRGGKGLNGVMRCDVESIAGWKHAVELDRLREAAGEESAPGPQLAIG